MRIGGWHVHLRRVELFRRVGQRNLQSLGRSSGMQRRADIAVVGAGIVGLAHAWAAARRGFSVALFERGTRARAASVRNFGMVWPIGQSAGDAHQQALRSRALWLELAESAGIWAQACGSIHLAFRRDELDVLSEFAERAPALGYEVQLLARDDVLARTPGARPENLLGGLWSGTELCVDPRTAVDRIPQWLAERYGVELNFSAHVHNIALPRVETSDGRVWNVDRALVCGGADFESLYPEVYARAGLQRCKLQMVRTAAQPNGWRMGPHLAGGLTLRHYANFEVCASLAALRRRIAEETPVLERYGIHVMASQNDRGEIVIGDSHEYEEPFSPFDSSEIESLILEQAEQMFSFPDFRVAERWHGVYASHPQRAILSEEVEPGVHVFTAARGAGMTMSFGLADSWWQDVRPVPGAQTAGHIMRPHGQAPAR